ncbi:helix-turn-helix domain-containing protein [Marinobacter subterrani]|uniref:helix-turn-helix domain-containing protein n=1 Tax=Marinobacter subterrani TaxID=1658765 RepID=UPI003B598B3C
MKKARSLVRRRPGQQRGRLTPLDERARLLELFDEAVAGGAARYKVAELVDISERTLKRWRSSDGRVTEDRRPDAERVENRRPIAGASSPGG